MASECCSPFSSQTQKEPLFVKKEEVEPKPEVVQIKEESIEFEVDDDYYDGRDCFRGSYDYANVVLPYLPKPMDCLLETGPPPFLIKTFQMVDDPKTDTVVSWSRHRLSFVVWDCYEFSKTILPKFFKHSNFSSFIRQLNTYGFRKVDPDRWEFANEGFQGGKKHLLKSIKRRSRCKRPTQGINLSVNSAKNSGLDSQVETLKKGQDVLKVKILNLKQQQKYLQHQVNAFDERLRRSEFKQQRMLLFLTKTTTEPDFVQRLMQKRVSRGELEGGDYGKRRRLLATQGFEDFGDCRLPEAKDITRSLPAFLADKSCSSVENNKRQEEVHSIYDMSEKLLKENSVFDDECAVNDSNFYQELEDLIAMPHNLDDSIVKPHDWSAYVSNYLVEKPDCVASIP